MARFSARNYSGTGNTSLLMGMKSVRISDSEHPLGIRNKDMASLLFNADLRFIQAQIIKGQLSRNLTGILLIEGFAFGY